MRQECGWMKFSADPQRDRQNGIRQQVQQSVPNILLPPHQAKPHAFQVAQNHESVAAHQNAKDRPEDIDVLGPGPDSLQPSRRYRNRQRHHRHGITPVDALAVVQTVRQQQGRRHQNVGYQFSEGEAVKTSAFPAQK